MNEPKIIEILDKDIFKFYNENNYDDNPLKFENYHKSFISGSFQVAGNQIGIEVLRNNDLISSCLLAAEGGGGTISKKTYYIEQDNITLCCGNSVFKLSLPHLDLVWQTITDLATCFEIYGIGGDYIIYGEMQISRLNKKGEIIWQKSCRDIWVTPKGDADFKIGYDSFSATDWDYNRYKFDFNGNLIEKIKCC